MPSPGPHSSGSLSSHFRSSCVPFSQHLLKTRPETPKVKPFDGDFFPLSTLSRWYTWIEEQWLWQVKGWGWGEFEEVQQPKPYGRAKHFSTKSLSHKGISAVKTMEEPGRITWKGWWCKVQILVFLLKNIHVMRSRERLFWVWGSFVRTMILNLLATFSQNPRYLKDVIPPPPTNLPGVTFFDWGTRRGYKRHRGKGNEEFLLTHKWIHDKAAEFSVLW